MKRIVTPALFTTLFPTLFFLIVFITLTTTEVQAQQKLQPSELCSNNPQAMASFADAVLEEAVRKALAIGAQEALTCSLVTGLTTLAASGPAPVRSVSGSPSWPDPDHVFHNLAGIQNLIGLTRLTLNNRGITDLSALSGLTNLTRLDLRYNPDLSNIQPLLDNRGIGAGDIVELRFTGVTCADQALLAAKGVEVRTELFSACT